MSYNKNKSDNDSQKEEMSSAIKKVQDIKNLTISQIDEIAEEVARVLSGKRIKTNQIRNVYGYISRVRNSFNITKSTDKNNEEIKNMIIFLKPKLAYIAGRISQVKESGMDKFYRTAIDSVAKTKGEELEKALDNFFKLSEAIVAYHRYYAG